MTIKQKILAMPVWKAVTVFIILFLSICFLVEWTLLKTVFSTINRSITYAEQIAKEDKDDIEKGFRQFDEQQAYDQAMSDCSMIEMRIPLLSTTQEQGCLQLERFKRLKSILKLPYVKHDSYARDLVEYSIKESHQKIDDLLSKNKFNPQLCIKDDS